jgi:hypothetical protein
LFLTERPSRTATSRALAAESAACYTTGLPSSRPGFPADCNGQSAVGSRQSATGEQQQFCNRRCCGCAWLRGQIVLQVDTPGEDCRAKTAGRRLPSESGVARCWTQNQRIFGWLQAADNCRRNKFDWPPCCTASHMFVTRSHCKQEIYGNWRMMDSPPGSVRAAAQKTLSTCSTCCEVTS